MPARQPPERSPSVSRSPRTARPLDPPAPHEQVPLARTRAIRQRLLAWYDEHEQPFPWRTARDPYAAMVAAVAA